MTTGEVRVVNAVTGGEKGSKLARFDLIPIRPLTLLAEHFGRGAAKYTDRNWERGYDWSLSYAALQRHLTAWWGGEDCDPELGSSHLDAVMWHAVALREFVEAHPELDDRPKSVKCVDGAALNVPDEAPSTPNVRTWGDFPLPQYCYGWRVPNTVQIQDDGVTREVYPDGDPL